MAVDDQDPAYQAVNEIAQTMDKYTKEPKADDLVQTYEEVNEVLQQLDTLHEAIIMKHEADFVVSYKDHMAEVQAELAKFKRKTSDHYLQMKKSEKIRMFEVSLNFLREEAIKMA